MEKKIPCGSDKEKLMKDTSMKDSFSKVIAVSKPMIIIYFICFSVSKTIYS